MSVKPVWLTIEAPVAETVTFDVPAGVPGSGGGLWPPPPPHAGISVSSNSIISRSPIFLRFVPTRKIAGRNSPTAAIHLLGPEVWRSCALAVGAVVVIVMETLVVFAVPPPFIDAGLKMHFDSDGSPEHARLIVPLNPEEFTTVIDILPVPPGAAMVTVGCDELDVAKNPGVIVNV